MCIEWQVVALSVLVVAGGACVPAGSKTSEDTTEDTVDDGSGGGGTDTEVTVEECYPGNLSREVSECLIEAGRDGYVGMDGWDQSRYENALRVQDCNNSELGEFRAAGLAYAEAWEEIAACWDACADGDYCAEYYRSYAECSREYSECRTAAMRSYDCDIRSDGYDAANDRCSDAHSTCMQSLNGIGCEL